MHTLKQAVAPIYFDGIEIPPLSTKSGNCAAAPEIVFDETCNASRLPSIGGKAANLHHLSAQGVPVPKWVCVSSDVCAAVFAEQRTPIEGLLNNIDYRNANSIQQGSDGIRRLIEQVPVAYHIRREIDCALQELGSSRFAVRSSGLAEDSSLSSHAGLFDTFLYVSANDVVERMKRCWASAFTPGNLVYAQHKGANEAPRPVAVVIQAMIDSEAAGVMFMADPGGSLDDIVVAAGYGLGEGIVSDQVASDTYIYSRTAGTWRCDIAEKTGSVRFDSSKGQGTRLVDVSTAKRWAPVLSEAQREALREQGEKISRLYDQFQDIEWAFDAAGKLYITQSRPITTLPRGQQLVFDNSNIVESYPGITSPLTVSHIQHCYEVLFRNASVRLGASKKRIRKHNHVFKNLLGYISGRVYYNLSNWYGMFRLVPAAEPYLPVWEEMLGISRRVDVLRHSWLQRLKELPRVIWVAARVLWYFVFLNFYMNACAQTFRRIEKDFRSRDIAKMDNHALADLHDRLEAEVLHGWEITLLNDLYAFVFTAAVRRYLRNIGAGENVFGGLMAGDSKLESTAPVRSMIAMADAVRQDPRLHRQLQEALELDSKDQRLVAFAELFDDDRFVRELQHHLERFGDRCPEELKLESTCFRDDPQALLQLIASYAASNMQLQELDAKRLSTKARANAELRAALSGHPLRRVLIGCTLSLARRSIRYRESSRLDRARAFGLIRAVFCTLGTNLANEQALGEPRDVFFLTVDELLGFVSGATVNVSLQKLVADRKADRDSYEALAPAERIRTQGTVRSNTVSARRRSTTAETKDRLQGTGCSAGLVTAEAVLVRNPVDAGDVAGRVLVAEMTDPGWVFLMASAAALIVEKGSLLSHTAIIGRELGVPTVVGVAGATDLIRNGQRVQVNGQTGEICLHHGGCA